MAQDLFGGLGNIGGLGDALGGLMGGLTKSGLIPKDTPEGKLLAAQSDLSDLRAQESELLLAIGRQAYQQNPSAWPEHAKLQLVQQNIAQAEATLSEAQQAQEQSEAAQAAEDAKGRCSQCGYKNPEGVKFCQECGTSLSQGGPKHCTSCGVELAPGTRFCGTCGARQEE
jgi:hypothetical protein